MKPPPMWLGGRSKWWGGGGAKQFTYCLRTNQGQSGDSPWIIRAIRALFKDDAGIKITSLPQWRLALEEFADAPETVHIPLKDGPCHLYLAALPDQYQINIRSISDQYHMTSDPVGVQSLYKQANVHPEQYQNSPGLFRTYQDWAIKTDV